ncbi:tetratricopeptide repeat protein [Desulfobacterales bacterium HSG2]|nr:tetratricopeptide repeat protein [Desulfobacterales bacterium HSG2]
MKKLIVTTLFIILFTTASAAFAASPRDQVDLLVRAFGELTVKDEPLVSRVHKVFERVMAAADKRAGCDPKLLMIREADDPWALCLEDGTIVLTQKGLDICYKNVDKETGDSRVAFVLGHELAHLFRDDFWDWQIVKTVIRFKPKAVQDILRVLDTSENIKKDELQADSYGLLYATMAGYDPKAVADEGGRNFLREWVEQITGKTACVSETHPLPETRAKLLLAQMKSLRDAERLFHIGVRLYQVGNYSEALTFLKAFQKKFPCREVLNNIGLCHYQLAIRALAEYDRKRVCRWKPSVIVDTETLAGVFRGEAKAKKIFKREMREAIGYFGKACEKDPYYVPARVNISAAHIMTEAYDKAVPHLNDTLRRREDDRDALNNHAIAMYEFQSGLNMGYFEQTVRALKDLTEKHPKFADAWYNLGRVLSEGNRTREAGDAWRAYLRLEPAGGHADLVRKELGTETAELAARSGRFIREPFVRPGTFDKKAQNRLSGFAERTLELRNLSGRYFSGNDLHILVLENAVMFVESPVSGNMRLSELNIGPARRILPGCSGSETFVYDQFALDVRDGLVEKVVHF